MIRGYDEAAVCRDVLSADPADAPEQSAKQPNRRPEYIKQPLRKHWRIGPPAIAFSSGRRGGAGLVQSRQLFTQ